MHFIHLMHTLHRIHLRGKAYRLLQIPSLQILITDEGLQTPEKQQNRL